MRGNPKMIVVGLNTNLYYRNNDLTANLADPSGQLSWLNETLYSASSRGLKVNATFLHSMVLCTTCVVMLFKDALINVMVRRLPTTPQTPTLV